MSRTTYTGASEKDGKMYCDMCGADLTPKGSAEYVAHADSADSYYNFYNCVKCGNLIKIETKRTGKNLKMWR